MKPHSTISLAFICISICLLISCSRINKPDLAKDIFHRYADNMLSIKGLSYQIHYLKKEVFSDDTTKSSAKVTFYKHDNTVSFLRVVREDTHNELLFVNDSAWDVDLKNKSMTYLGGRANVQYHGLFTYFPKGNLLIDTSLFRQEPYWTETKTGKGLVKVAFTIANKPAEVTDVRFEILIDSTELRVRHIIEASNLGKMGNMYQEKIFSDYQWIPSESDLKPEYYHKFNRIFVKELPQPISAKPKNQYLKNLVFKDLDGNSVSLPKSGLIFLDLWYVGCFPCMKATPVIEKMYELYKDKIHFYSVNEMDNDMAKIIRFKNKMGVTMPVLVAKEKTISPSVGDGGYPFFVLLDAATGKVLWSYTGYTIDLEQQIRDGIQPFLNVNQ